MGSPELGKSREPFLKEIQLIGKQELIQQQTEANAKQAAELKRIQSMSNKNLASEIRREMRTTGKTNLLCFAIGLVSLLALEESLDNGQQWYCQRTAPIRPKTGRIRKKTELKKAAAKQQLIEH